MKAYLELIKIDLKLALRQRTVIFFNYLFPLIFFFAMGSAFRAAQSYRSAAQVMTMSLTLGILGSGLFGAGVRSIQEREMNILRRYKVTPITPGPLLVASLVTGLIIFMPNIILLLVLTHYRFNLPWPAHMGDLLLFIALSLVTFRAIGLVIASVANNMQEGTILVQLFYFPMLLLSGATIPASAFGPKMTIVSNFIPSTYLVQGVQGMMLGSDRITQHWLEVGALIIAAVVGWIVGTKLFRWEKEEKIKNSAKAWVAAVIAPFLILGIYESFHQKDSHPQERQRSGLESSQRTLGSK